jgi:hypothetical protein
MVVEVFIMAKKISFEEKFEKLWLYRTAKLECDSSVEAREKFRVDLLAYLKTIPRSADDLLDFCMDCVLVGLPMPWELDFEVNSFLKDALGRLS